MRHATRRRYRRGTRTIDKQRSRHQRHLRLEPLEDRRLLSVSITLNKPGMAVASWDSTAGGVDYLAEGAIRIGDGDPGNTTPVYTFQIPNLGNVAQLDIQIDGDEYNTVGGGTEVYIGENYQGTIYKDDIGFTKWTQSYVSDWIWGEGDGDILGDYVRVKLVNDGWDDLKIFGLSLKVEYSDISDQRFIGAYQTLYDAYTVLDKYAIEVSPGLRNLVDADEMMAEAVQKTLGVVDALWQLNGVGITSPVSSSWGSWVTAARGINSTITSTSSVWNAIRDVISYLENALDKNAVFRSAESVADDVADSVYYSRNALRYLTEEFRSSILDGEIDFTDTGRLNVEIDNAKLQLNALIERMDYDLSGYAYKVAHADAGEETKRAYLDMLRPLANYSYTDQAGEQLDNSLVTNYRDFLTNLQTDLVSWAINATPLPAANDSYDVDEDSVLTVDAASGILANDGDDDPAPLSAVGITGPSHGALVLNTSGWFRYTPGADFAGEDSFTYRAESGIRQSEPATVTITVNQVNDEPTARDDNLSVAANSQNNLLDVCANDTDPDGDSLTISGIVSTQYGTAYPANGGTRVAYTPPTGFVGIDTVRYTVSDSNGGTDTASVIIEVVDGIPPIGWVSIRGAEEFDGNAATLDTPVVRIDPSASDNSGTVAQMRYHFNGQSWGSWQAYSGSPFDVTLPQSVIEAAGGGPIGVSIQYRDPTGNDSSTYSDTLNISAVPLIVTGLQDTIGPDGSLSLREALRAASLRPGEAITFDPALFHTGPATITLGGTELSIAGDLQIEGPGAELLTIDAAGQSRVFYVGSVAATLSGLNITGGSADVGGGISNWGGTLTVTNSTLSGNSATGSGWDSGGGGIFNWGTLTVTNSTLSGNSASGGGIFNGGGGIYNSGTLTVTNSTLSGNDDGGGIYNDDNGTLTVTNSTLSGNSASFWGGGIYNSGTLTVTNSTLSGNSATGNYGRGGGISNYRGTLTVTNSIVAGNAASTGAEVHGSYTNESSLIGVEPGFVRNPSDGGDGWVDDPDTADVDESANNDYGDLRLAASSIAINLGDGSLIPADTLDLDNDGDTSEPVPMDRDGNPRVVGDAVDLGAFEFQGNPVGAEPRSTVVTILTDMVDWADGDISLREAIVYATLGGLATPVTFDASLSGGTILLGGAELWLDSDVQIDASAVGEIVIDAQQQSRVFTVTGGASVVLNSLNITGGSAVGGGGIYNYSYSTLTVTNSTISGNSASYPGGGIYNDRDSTLTVTNSTISGNSASDLGGGIYNWGTLTVTNSTLSGNSATGNYGRGGGIYKNYDGTLTVTNSIVARNVALDSDDISGSYTNESSLIGEEPGFVQNPSDGGDGWVDDPDTADVDESANNDYGNLRLRPGSPAIDAGSNDLAVDADGSPLVTDIEGNPRILDGDGDGTATVDIGAFEYAPSVIGSYVYYRGSWFDDGLGDGAIAADKRPLLPEQTATAANYSNFNAGINGLMVDINKADDGTEFLANDFVFRVGNQDDPNGWLPAPAPSLILTCAGDGVADSIRVQFAWPNGEIRNTWLEVTVLANGNTGLIEDHVFYFGNAVGETGNESTNALVNAADVVAIRDNPRGELNPAGIDNPFDINRDMRVDALDLILARNNATSPLAALRLITPSAPSPAPRFAADAEGRLFPPTGEGESMFAIRSLASEGTSFLESLDGLMAVQVARPAVDSPLPSPMFGKLLRRFGSAIK